MARFRFEPGTTYRQAGATHSIVASISLQGASSWLVKRLDDGSALVVARTELERLYVAGEVERHGDDAVHDAPAGSRVPRGQRRHEELSEADLKRRTCRRKFLEIVETQVSRGSKTVAFSDALAGGPKTLLEAAIKVCAPKAGLETPPSVATYYRWRAVFDPEDSSALVGKFSSRGNRLQVDSMVREAVMAALRRMLDKAIDERGAGRLTTIGGAELASQAQSAVDVLNATRSGENFKVPCQATLYNWWNTLPAILRDTVKFGHVEARKRYRTIKGHEHPLIAMDEAEYDETLLPFFFYDERLGIPLGRATLSWFLCPVSHSVLGWYNGFEGAGDLVMTSAARHMCLPKAYVADEYPSLKNAMIQHGIPRMIRIDNSKPAWGRTAKMLCEVLDTDWDWCPSRTPYFKPIVEGMFKKLNDQLLQKLPGFVLPATKIYGDDYDPTENAILGIRHFQMIFAAWLVDYYHPRRQARLGASPNEVFARGIAQVPAGLMDSARDLRSAFAIVRDGRLNRLDHKGVVFEGLQYRGDALQALRNELGGVLKVRIKVDPSDLRSIYVWHPMQRSWLEAAAARLDYAKGRTLHQHLIIRKYEREKFGTDGERAFEAERELAALISTVVDDAQSMRRNALAARYMGIGTDVIFSNLDHDGKLQPLTGPFAGQRLNPMACMQPPVVLEQPGPTSPPMEPPSVVGDRAAGVEAEVVSAPCPLPAAALQRARKTFKADLSLSKGLKSENKRNQHG